MRRQAVQLAWEFHRSTRQRAEKDLSGWINPNATDVIPSVGRGPSPTSDVALKWQRHATQPDTLKRQAVGMQRGAEDNAMSSSAKRAHTPRPQLSQIPPQPDV